MKDSEKLSNSSLQLGMSFMASIFFIFGFITTFNIALKDLVQEAFKLNAFQAQLVNGAFFVTYFCFSFAIGGIIKRIGYKMGVIAGLLLVAAGSFLFWPALNMGVYAVFLLAVFVMASGVVFLQTAANPYVAILGHQDTAPVRLNLVQALNSIATMIAPLLIGLIVSPAVDKYGNAAVQNTFVAMGVIVVAIAAAIFFIKLPEISGGNDTVSKSVWKHPQVVFGALGIFCYVGAEVGTSSAIVPYLTGVMDKNAAMTLVAMYWGGAMVGRLFGSIMLGGLDKSKKMLYSAIVIVIAFIVGWYVTGNKTLEDGTKVFAPELKNGFIFMGIAIANYIAMLFAKGRANVALGLFGVVAACLLLVAFTVAPSAGIWALLSIGFFNSIMFPNIFALGVKDLTPSEMPTAAGLINTLIVGGAIVPVLMGLCMDGVGVKFALLIPAVCYLYIALFGFKLSKLR